MSRLAKIARSADFMVRLKLQHEYREDENNSTPGHDGIFLTTENENRRS